MLEKAVRLCGGDRGVLWTIDGEHGQLAAARGLSAEFIALLRERGASGNPALQRVMGGERVVEFADTANSEFYRAGDPLAKAAVEAGVRSLIWVALVREGVNIGAFAIGRAEVSPFSDKQIALLQNFAAQAVIAMENARLITETREALEQQTATAEVLQVINSSPADLDPVFGAILEKAFQVCGGVQGSLWTFEGNRPRLATARNLSPDFVEILREEWERRGPRENHPMARLARGERVVQILDMAVAETYKGGDPTAVAAVEIGHVHTVIFVALIKDSALLGAFVIARREVRAFTDKEIALLQNFAAQAVIAIENARLIDELRERTDAAETARVEAEAANEAKSTFLATMSHEIRTPMNGVLGMMEVLERQGIDDAQRPLVATMRDSAQAL